MTKSEIWSDGPSFEKSVTRIARALWPDARVGGPIIMQDRERDGVYITEEAVHIIECTMCRTKQKAEYDIEKSVKLARALRRENAGKPIQCWFITADEPTPDQRTVAIKTKEFPVNVESYDVFRRRLIDANKYLDLRSEYAFGSARNLHDGSIKIERSEYVELDLLRFGDAALFSTGRVASEMLSGLIKRAVLLGDYGAGKSMTLREIYLKIVDAYRRGKTPRFPVYVNLRDHSGQKDPVEVLERHARSIGFQAAHQLVRAWRAGFVVILLDGFDELSATGWMAFGRRLKHARFSTIEAVRRFVKDTPPDCPVLVAGRLSYFDNEAECLNAVGMLIETASIFSLNDFTEEQITKYVGRLGITGALPSWLPSRPLLIGALAARGALSAEVIASSGVEPGEGWDNLLRAVCAREASTHEVVDTTTVREVIEKLTSMARAKGGLNAPLSLADMVSAYKQVRGEEPDERAQALLLRLPGLGRAAEDVDSRAFIDIDFASAAAAGEVSRFIEEPYSIDDQAIYRTKEVLQELGVEVASHQLRQRSVPDAKIYVALKKAAEASDGAVPEHVLGVDIAKIVMGGNFLEPREIMRVTLREVIIDELDLTGSSKDFSGLAFHSCLVSTLYMPDSKVGDTYLPRFVQCEIEHIEGRGNEAQLDRAMFDSCKFGTFSAVTMTNADIVDSRSLEPGVKTLVICLRKLFLQKGSGRKQNAFYRGIGGGSGITTKMVDKVLNAISSADFAQPVKRSNAEPVWQPNRRLAARAKAMVASPRDSKESLVSIARAIK